MRYITYFILLLTYNLIFSQGVSVTYSIGIPYQASKFENNDTKRTDFFQGQAFKEVNISFTLKRNLWLGVGYAKGNEITNFQPQKNGYRAGSSIMQSKYYSCFVAKNFKIEKRILFQPSFSLFFVQHQRSWDYFISNYSTSDSEGRKLIVGGISAVHEGWKIQPTPNIKLIWKPYNELQIHLGLSYSLGLKPVQVFSGDLYINGKHLYSGNSTSKGTKIIASIGASVVLEKEVCKN